MVPLYGLPFVSCLSRAVVVVLTCYNKPAYSDSHQCSYHCSRHECSNDQHQQQEKYCFSHWNPTFHFILLFTVINFCYSIGFTPFGAVHIIFSNLSSTVPGCFCHQVLHQFVAFRSIDNTCNDMQQPAKELQYVFLQ